ncbi:hypothetical protein EYF80_055002 [Liparis tanakae]|uniref:Uncharacterized protein n=1 Tax=Liparis tanakae TaxID=230148 RepID=A0A4Z2F113_9TELE|nr:hypothetical protein EYF80_055002 [Liparis tanakae]
MHSDSCARLWSHTSAVVSPEVSSSSSSSSSSLSFLSSSATRLSCCSLTADPSRSNAANWRRRVRDWSSWSCRASLDSVSSASCRPCCSFAEDNVCSHLLLHSSCSSSCS